MREREILEGKYEGIVYYHPSFNITKSQKKTKKFGQFGNEENSFNRWSFLESVF